LKGKKNKIGLIIIQMVQVSQMRILIIDDDPAGTEILEMLLSPAKAVIRHACNGESGLALTKEFIPDIILLDYMLPGIDGLQTTRGLRKITTAPIMILSVLDDPVTLAKVLNEGADDYLIKPASREVLLAHINNLMRRFAQRHKEQPTLLVSLQSA